MCREHPASVTEFYKNAHVGNVNDDLSCCRDQTFEPDIINFDDGDDDDNDKDDKISQITYDNLYDFIQTFLIMRWK